MISIRDLLAIAVLFSANAVSARFERRIWSNHRARQNHLVHDRAMVAVAESAAIIRVAYESHFKLAQHYSSIVFQARVAITTVIVLAVGLGLQILPLGDSAEIEWLGIPARGLAVYAAALLINLLHAMEVSYLKRFYQIVRGGREIEKEHDAQSYFSAYDKPESWPLHVAYAAGIFVLVHIFIAASWSTEPTYQKAVLIIVTAYAPLVLYAFSILRLRSNVRNLLHAASSRQRT